MAGRFPFDSQGHNNQNPLHNAQVRAALGLSQVDEALYLQRQQELQRDFQIRQMLLAEQIDQQTRIDSMLQEQQIKAIGEHLQEFPDLQQHYSRLILNEQFQRQEERNLFRERQIHQEELRRRAIAQNQPQPQQAKSSSPKIQAGTLRDIAADSLAGNAMKKSEAEKRVFAKPDIECVVAAKKRSRSDASDSIDSKSKKMKDMTSPLNEDDGSLEASIQAAAEETNEDGARKLPAVSADVSENAKASAHALLGFASTPSMLPPSVRTMPMRMPVPPMPIPRHHMYPPMIHGGYSDHPGGTISDLLNAATEETKTGKVIAALKNLKNIKKHVEWSDSESEHEEDLERQEKVAREKGDVIQLPGFSSILPQLPEEPEVVLSKEKRKKHKGLLDDDSVEKQSKGKSTKANRKGSRASENGDKSNSVNDGQDLTFAIDTWWPSATSIRRERKMSGEGMDDHIVDDEVFGKDAPFQANTEKLRQKLSDEVTPGVLEKVPHCRIHRQLMMKRKNSSVPELVHCFQVTELCPNDVMVCCSHCGTWRHTSCGGHYKPYSVREAIEAPFVPVCDRCHEEMKVLQDYPLGRKRLERQRTEQVRRGLATSAAMRQASFSKHGGTYKWPLGSVSATHIGGHTRSVHTRHDKAEKQWMDMSNRLGRGFGYRPKERIKFRTKELERLLVSVEDAEGHTDRHNMMLFLLQDTLRKDPVGFEKRRQNIFDPEEDATTQSSTKRGSENNSATASFERNSDENNQKGEAENIVCCRVGCTRKPRFDSLFCSDACGVSALECDLLRTFQYASDIHPSLLRN